MQSRREHVMNAATEMSQSGEIRQERQRRILMLNVAGK
jgi:hypothetical protein